MSDIRVILKSGYSFVVPCKKATVKALNGEISGYSFEGVERNKPLYINFSDIAAVINESRPEESEDET